VPRGAPLSLDGVADHATTGSPVASVPDEAVAEDPTVPCRPVPQELRRLMMKLLKCRVCCDGMCHGGIRTLEAATQRLKDLMAGLRGDVRCDLICHYEKDDPD
jgi:hypothetical protein